MAKKLSDKQVIAKVIEPYPHKTLFVLYDGRAAGGEIDEDRCMEVDTAHTEKEARQAGKGLWSENDDYLWYEYEVQPGNILINPKPRYDLPPWKSWRETVQRQKRKKR